MTITVKRDGVTTSTRTPFTGRLVVRRGSDRVAVFPREGTLGIRVQGPQGPPGPAGGSTGGAATRYVHTQSVPAKTWVVTHNLGCHPAVDCEDAVGNVILGAVRYLDMNNLTVDFHMFITGIVNCV